MNKRNRMLNEQYERVLEALDDAEPGTDEFLALITQLGELEKVRSAKKSSSQLIPGVRNDTLAIGAFTVAEIGVLASLAPYLPKNMFGFLSKFKNQ